MGGNVFKSSLPFGSLDASSPHSLTEVSAGVCCTIAQSTAPLEYRPRLMELGLVPGTKVELVRFAPLGDRLRYAFEATHLSLRKHEAAHVLVSVDS